MLGPDEGDDGPAGTSSAGTARSVNVVGYIGSWIEMDHERHPIDVDPPRRDVGGDEHVEAACSKRRQASLALALTAISMDRR